MDGTKGANPFLIMEDDYSSPPSNNSNPFLTSDIGFDNSAVLTDNPFFTDTNVPVANATNPFAFDATGFDVSEVPVFTSNSVTETNNIFNDNLIDNHPPDIQNVTTDFFSLTNDEPPVINEQIIVDTKITIQKPDVLELKNTHTVAKVDDAIILYSSDEELTKVPPRRPPPPRPVIPPSKETQDLIMSVTGAMDATSSHLLDRIPPTRTPSPVSMRDLHSPSPTPEHGFADFLDVDNAKPQPVSNDIGIDLFDVSDTNDQQIIQPEGNKNICNSTDPFISLMSSSPVCDINQNHSILQQQNQAPVRPPRPAPPPRVPPQKPPPPTITSAFAAKPEPAAEPATIVDNSPAPNDFMDMLGESIGQNVEKSMTSNADIMSLYSAPTVTSNQDNVIDLLCEGTNTDLATVQDSVISPEITQDVHMDTNDTHCKESGSSSMFNPFASEETMVSTMVDTTSPVKNQNENCSANSLFSTNQTELKNEIQTDDTPFPKGNDEFDAFAAKFESAAKDEGKNGHDPFAGGINDAWGDVGGENKDAFGGFEGDEPFDAFLNMQEPPAVPQGTPSMLSKRESQESDEDKDFSVFIKPKGADDSSFNTNIAMPVLAPPPKSPIQNTISDMSPRFNPFDQQTEPISAVMPDGVLPHDGAQFTRTDSQETPPTPLFDDDVSQPLEDFPRINYTGDGWEMQLRQPNKKKITGQRFWKKILVRLVVQEGCPILQLYNAATDKDPFQELPLQPCYSVSEIGAQQYDNYGKIFTVKLQYVFYKERPGVRPGQVTKAERITNKLSQFAAYAIQGDYQGVKEFGSDLKKLGLPVEHAPQVSQLLKLGSLCFEDMKQFSICIEEALFRLSAHRDRALHYKMEEVQITAVDELYVEQSSEGHVEKQIARVRLFFLGFLSGMPDIELGVNDMRRQGKEVVGRHDIIPVVTEEWIRLEEVEFHACVTQDEYHNTHIIKFKPPDACYIELMRFRIRPPKNRELPLQLKPTLCITGNKVELRADVLVPGFASRKLGQVPCEDVMIRFPIPECWIYLFRVEKHFRYGSVKSAHRRTGKIKGIERFLGTVDTLQESLIEVTSGQAKYEHQHRAVVWRIPRLPKEGQGAYTTHNLVCRLALTSYDQVPDQLAEFCYVEFTMPATQASHTTVRSVSTQNSQSDDPPEKYVRYLARHEYKVGIEHTESEEPNAYASATVVSRQPAPVPEEPAPPPPDPESSSDSD